MVLKPKAAKINGVYRFENDVNMYGTQATDIVITAIPKFENDVNMYGTQAPPTMFPV